MVDTDLIAREIARPGQPALAEIQATFGVHSLTATGELDREHLARLVFADTSARQKLEAILHPRIRERWLEQVEVWRREQAPLGFVVIPLLFETQAEKYFEKMVCVACSADSQRERLSERGWSPEQIRQRIAAQLPVEQKMARSQFVVWTEGTLEVHRQQWECILARL